MEEVSLSTLFITLYTSGAQLSQDPAKLGLMQEGLYESLMTKALSAELARATDVQSEGADVVDADQPHVLAQHVSAVVERALRSRGVAERVELANQILRMVEEPEQIEAPVTQLTRVISNELGGDARYASRPSTPLNDAALLTNIRGEPSLGAELRTELESADRVDLLCAFVKWHGIRVIEAELKRLAEREIPFRVITTTYIGATERTALDRLVREFGAQVRINFNESKTRLHAKAWHFQRNTGFDTAYVGSSNLSRTALLDGLEWNVRLSRTGTPHLLEKFSSTFETYWNDPAFEEYDPDDEACRDRLDDALALAAGARKPDPGNLVLSGLDVQPYPFQQHMLDALQAERELHDQHRNLLVAATGTGKTVIAALDYRRLAESPGTRRPRLLFVAHRKEILEQSLRKYREILADASFGELYVGNQRPERWDHVFASIQSLNSYGIENIPKDHFEIIVVDEFHHAAAASYRELLERMEPRELLGLTATPERADGFDVRTFFDGRTAAELRLWEALEAGILCPFHYFMVSDNTDLSNVTWRRGRYDESELGNLYTGNAARTRIILKELHSKITNVGTMRALGFCVGVSHANYMAQQFNDAGIPARALSGATPGRERQETLSLLRTGQVNVVFSADLLNEGIDIPDVDTVLFLRPTESATIFLQQLGRGLRQRPDKPVLTVLDFVGNQHDEFRFDQKLGALTGRSRKQLERDVNDGFPFLPSGCQIVLDQQAQKLVLGKLRKQIHARWPFLVRQLRDMGKEVDLHGFLDETGLRLTDILKGRNKTWTALQRSAGRMLAEACGDESYLSGRVRALAHVDDPRRAHAYEQILRGDRAVDPVLQSMFFYSLWPKGHASMGLGDPWNILMNNPSIASEMREVIQLSYRLADRPVEPLPGRLSDIPLSLHAQYQREEILAATGWVNAHRVPDNFREGVAYVPERNIDLLFVTLRKSQERFSPTTMYRDYPISRDLVHWESQSTTTITSRTGRRYLEGSSTVLLFVREAQKNELGTSPYYCLGSATYVNHRGEKPIAITWQLERSMPADLFAAWSIAASA